MVIVGLLFCLETLEAATHIRIMTFNAEWLVYTEDETDKYLRGPEYTLNKHFERIAGIIESLEPDIVNLIEVTNESSVNYLVNILHEKGLNDYKVYHLESKDNTTNQDVALILKITPKKVQGEYLQIFYSMYAGEKWRGQYTWTTSSIVQKSSSTSITKNIVYFIDIGIRKLDFLGLHLRAIPDNEQVNTQREVQACLASKILREEIIAKGYIPIVLSDLNDYDTDVPDRDDTKSTQTNVLDAINNYDQTQPGKELVNAAEKIVRVFD
jgi:hypothetical protein